MQPIYTNASIFIVWLECISEGINQAFKAIKSEQLGTDIGEELRFLPCFLIALGGSAPG